MGSAGGVYRGQHMFWGTGDREGNLRRRYNDGCNIFRDGFSVAKFRSPHPNTSCEDDDSHGSGMVRWFRALQKDRCVYALVMRCACANSTALLRQECGVLRWVCSLFYEYFQKSYSLAARRARD